MTNVENAIRDMLIEEIDNLNDSDLTKLWSGIVIGGEYYEFPLVMPMIQFRRDPEARKALGINSLIELAESIGDFVNFNGYDNYVVVKPDGEITSASNVIRYINIDEIPEMNPHKITDESVIDEVIEDCLEKGGILGGYELDSRGHVTDDSTEDWYIIDEDALRADIQHRLRGYFAW